MKEFFPILHVCPLFDGIGREYLFAILGCLGARVKEIKKHQIIFSEGDTANTVGIVLSGRAQVIKEDYYGNRTIVGMAEPGELFAESFACAGAVALPVSIIAAEDCKVMLIDSHRIAVSCSNACSFHSQLIQNLLKIVAEKNIQFNQKMEILTQRTTREKLLVYLNSQAKQKGSNSFTIPYDRQALADFLGVERSAMSAEISKLRKDGILHSRKNHFEMLK